MRCEKCGEAQKQFNGCEEESDVAEQRWGVKRCPVRLVTEQTANYLQAFNLLQLGILPYQQGWLRESNKFIEAMQVIGNEIRKIEAKQMKEMKK